MKLSLITQLLLLLLDVAKFLELNELLSSTISIDSSPGTKVSISDKLEHAIIFKNRLGLFGSLMISNKKCLKF